VIGNFLGLFFSYFYLNFYRELILKYFDYVNANKEKQFTQNLTHFIALIVNLASPYLLYLFFEQEIPTEWITNLETNLKLNGCTYDKFNAFYFYNLKNVGLVLSVYLIFYLYTNNNTFNKNLFTI